MANNPLPLAAHVALVTGGAGGIGAAVSGALAAAGARVVVTYNSDAAKAEKLLATLPGTGHRSFQVAVQDSARLAELADFVQASYGRLDVLVNNAGVTTPVPHADLEALSDEWIDRIFQTNWRGAFATTRACLPLLQASGNGLVVNMSSVAGQTGIGSNVAYCASKAALDSLTRSLGRALAPAVRVVSVSPGWVLGEYTTSIDPAYLAKQLAAKPLGRLATPADVADTVVALATTLRFTTGAIIPVDGGRPLG